MSDNPAAPASPFADLIAGIRGWLGKQIDQLLPYPLMTRQIPPASMTDEQLHEAIYRVGAELVDNISVHVLMPTYANNEINPDPRFPRGMPTTVRDHTLTMFTSAHDSFGLSVIGLGKHATAAALGPISNIAETLTLTRWLLEHPSEADRQGRAFRLMAESAVLMERNLHAMAQQDQVTIASTPPSASQRAAQFLSGSDGYFLYALTSAGGVHPAAQRAVLFYGNPSTRIMDFDFKGMHVVRAFWITRSIELHLELCRIVVPVLGWQRWEPALDKLARKLRPLAEETQRRFAQPHLQAWKLRVASGRAPDIV